MGRICSFVDCFRPCFQLINSAADELSSKYLQGLYVADKRNCAKISKHIDRNSQSLNHFISDSPWDWRPIGVHIARLFVKMLPSYWAEDLCLSIDESGIPKKGNASVGVAHQYCGQLGKGANCQVGVYAGLICRGFYCLINAILYLPEKWCKRTDADVPPERSEHKTKIELAYEMILHAKQVLAVPFKWVNFDSFYGRDQAFLYQLHQRDITFVGDIPRDATLYLKEPTVYIPKNNGKGRKYTRCRVKGKSTTPQQIACSLKAKDFKKISVRITKEGSPVKTTCYSRTVYLALKEEGAILEVRLLIRKDEDGTIRYALSNNLKASIHRLAFMHSQRYFIERSFLELKQQLGLNQYQVRGYGGWHRHMHMCMMGLLFIQCEKMAYLKINEAPSTPLLAELIRIVLPQKIRTITDVLAEFKKLKVPMKRYCAGARKSPT